MRHYRDQRIQKVRLEYPKRSFYLSGIRNNIPDISREEESLAHFKHRFRKYLLNLQGRNTTPWKSKNIIILAFPLSFGAIIYRYFYLAERVSVLRFI